MVCILYVYVNLVVLFKYCYIIYSYFAYNSFYIYNIFQF